MNFAIRVLPAADADVDETATYIAHDSIEQGLRFYDAVNATYQAILQAPTRSRPRSSRRP
jgi:plasmid stabilization system protein ParE